VVCCFGLSLTYACKAKGFGGFDVLAVPSFFKLTIAAALAFRRRRASASKPPPRARRAAVQKACTATTLSHNTTKTTTTTDDSVTISNKRTRSATGRRRLSRRKQLFARGEEEGEELPSLSNAQNAESLGARAALGASRRRASASLHTRRARKQTKTTKKWNPRPPNTPRARP
jgi:hypothetical protein